MGRRGPIPRPKGLRLVEGDREERRKATGRPSVPGRPSPPAGLDRVALAEWRRVVPLLEAEGLLSRLDRGVLAGYCLTYSRMLAAEATLGDGAPLVGKGSHGGEQPRPEVRIARDAASLLAKLADSLGLSPAGRARLGIGGKPEAPEDATWLPPELRGDSGPARRDRAGSPDPTGRAEFADPRAPRSRTRNDRERSNAQE